MTMNLPTFNLRDVSTNFFKEQQAVTSLTKNHAPEALKSLSRGFKETSNAALASGKVGYGIQLAGKSDEFAQLSVEASKKAGAWGLVSKLPFGDQIAQFGDDIAAKALASPVKTQMLTCAGHLAAYIDPLFKVGKGVKQLVFEQDGNKSAHTFLRAGGSVAGISTIGRMGTVAGTALMKGDWKGKFAGFTVMAGSNMLGSWAGDKLATAIGNHIDPAVKAKIEKEEQEKDAPKDV